MARSSDPKKLTLWQGRFRRFLDSGLVAAWFCADEQVTATNGTAAYAVRIYYSETEHVHTYCDVSLGIVDETDARSVHSLCIGVVDAVFGPVKRETDSPSGGCTAVAWERMTESAASKGAITSNHYRRMGQSVSPERA